MTWLPRSPPRDLSVPASALGAVEAFGMEAWRPDGNDAGAKVWDHQGILAHTVFDLGIRITVRSETCLLSRGC